MQFGYIRVSTTKQKFDMQFNELHKYGVHEKNIYSDKCSGSTRSRPELDNLLSKLREGDTVVVYSLDRIARSLSHLIKLVNQFEKNGINLVSIKEPFIDTTAPHGKLMFNIIAAFAEFERDLIRERTIAGQRAARAEGRLPGRKKGLSEKYKSIAAAVYRDWKKGDQTIAVLMENHNIPSPSTFYKCIKYMEGELEEAETTNE